MPDAHSRRRCQVCVVGAGMAGYALASRLTSRGLTVVVLESGGKDLAAETAASLNVVDRPLGHYSRAETNRVRGMGGTSSIWGGRLIPIDPFQAQPRPHLGEIGWPTDLRELEQHTRDVERVFGVEAGSYDEEPTQNGDGPILPRSDELISARWSKTTQFSRRNLEKSWTRLAKKANLEVISEATVTQLEIDAATGRVQSVLARSVSGNDVRVAADHVVLATGTIEATRLLLWTRETLGHARFGGDSLGHYFQDHLRLEAGHLDTRDSPLLSVFGYTLVAKTLRSLFLELAPQAQLSHGVYGAFAYTQLDLQHGALRHLREAATDLQQGRVELKKLAKLAANSIPVARSLFEFSRTGYLPIPPRTRLRLMMGVEQMPNYDNRIALGASKDPFDVPLASISWSPTETDGRAFVAMAHCLDAFWSQAGRSMPRLHLHALFSKDPVEIAMGAHDAAHPSGTTRMGTTGSSSVVCPDLFTHDCPNLSVVTASVFPSAGSANPTLTLMALALAHAERLAGALLHK